MSALKAILTLDTLLGCSLVLSLVGFFMFLVEGVGMNSTEQLYTLFFPIIVAVNWAAHRNRDKPALPQIAALFMLVVMADEGCLAYEARDIKAKVRTAGLSMAIGMALLSFFVVHLPNFSIAVYAKRPLQTAVLTIPSLAMISGVGVFWSQKGSCLFLVRSYQKVAWLALYNLLVVHTNNTEGMNVVLFVCVAYLYNYIPYDHPCGSDKKCIAGMATIFSGIGFNMFARLILTLIDNFAERFLTIKTRIATAKDAIKTKFAGLFFTVAVIGGLFYWTTKINGSLPTRDDSWPIILISLSSFFGVMAYAFACPITQLVAFALYAGGVNTVMTRFSTTSDMPLRAGYLLIILGNAGCTLLLVDLDVATAKDRMKDAFKIYRERFLMAIGILVACIMMWSGGALNMPLIFITTVTVISSSCGCKVGNAAALYLTCLIIPTITPFSGNDVARTSGAIPTPPPFDPSHVQAPSTGEHRADAIREGSVLAFLSLMGLAMDFVRSYDADESTHITHTEYEPINSSQTHSALHDSEQPNSNNDDVRVSESPPSE